LKKAEPGAAGQPGGPAGSDVPDYSMR
jgi:hypothetical protein